MCLVLFVVSKILDSSELLSCLLEMGVEYYLVCIREGLLLCEKGMESPRGRGRLSGVRETQLLLRSNQSNRVEYTDLVICGHNSCNRAKMYLVIFIFPDLCYIV